MIKLDKINFIPVLNGGILNCALREDILIGNYRPTFYTKDAIFKYNKYLINPFHHNKLFVTIKNKGLLLPNSTIFADSVTRKNSIIVRKGKRTENVLIGDFIDEQMNLNDIKESDRHEYLSLNDYEVLTIDDNGLYEFKKINKVIRHKVKKDIFRVSTINGGLIEITGDHSLIKLNKEYRFEPEKICNLSVNNDYLLCGKELNNKIFGNKNREYIDISAIEINPIYGTKNDDYVEQHGHRIPLKFPLDDNTLKIFGYWIGDGSINNINIKNNSIGIHGVQDDILREMKYFCRRFNIKQLMQSHGHKTDWTISSSLLRKTFDILDLNGNSFTKRVPYWVFSLSKKQIASFLSGYISADGGVRYKAETGSYKIGVSSISKGLFDDISILLRILGIHFSVGVVNEHLAVCCFNDKVYPREKNYEISIWSYLCFRKLNDYGFKFIQKYKQNKFKHILKKTEDLGTIDTSSFYGNIPLEYLPEHIRKHFNIKFQKTVVRRKVERLEGINPILLGDFTFNRIKSIKKIIYNDYVYDLSVADVERFLCSGILVHNSGGLQGVTLGQKDKFGPEEVFKWQQEHSHIGFCVDDLPFKTDSRGALVGWEFDKEHFADHAEKTRQNIAVTRKYRDPTKGFWFYGIIQGRQYKEYKQWYDIIHREDDNLQGYCVKSPTNSPINMAETCIFAIENLKEKPIHFLGTGNMGRALIVYYASKFVKQPISFDSSSFDIGSQFRSYLLPFMMNKKIRFVSDHNLGIDSEVLGPEDIVDIEDLSGICDCAVCKAIGPNIRDMIKRNDPALGPLTSVHNVILNIRINNYVNQILHSRIKLTEFIRYNFDDSLANKLLLGMDMIDMAIEKGSEYALNFYKDDIILNEEVGKQKSVFQF